MLRLQRSKLVLPKRIQFFLKLILFSAAIHILILLMALFVLTRSRPRLFINSDKLNDAKVVLLPLIKQVKQQPYQSLNNPLPLQSADQKKEPEKKPQTTFQKSPPKKAALKKVAPKKIEPKKIEQKKTEPLKVEEKKEEAKKEPIKKDEPKTDQKESEPLKKEVEQKEVKKDEPKKENKKQERAQQLDKPFENVIGEITEDQAVDVGTTQTNVIYVGQMDLEALTLSGRIKEELSCAWKRPAGLPNSLIYQAVVYVSSNGVVSIEKETSSKAMALDAMARNFLLNYEFPKSVWGYEIEIVL